RRYAAFHIGLGVVTLWLAALAWWRPQPTAAAASGRRWRGYAVAAAVCLGLASQAPARLAHRDNVRLIYRETAPLLGRAVQLLGRLSPAAAAVATTPTAALSRAAPSLDLRGRDILLISIDALRADRLTGHHYKRVTTPNIDALAASGVRFDAAYTSTPHTSYAMTSLMTGKPMRSLLRQGLGGASETAAQLLQRYDYRTAAFYPPALFFIDPDRFEHFKNTGLGFEYRKVEFASAAQRVAQLRTYLDQQRDSRQRVFVWVHLFEPHEPYVAHAAYPFGERAIDRYDAEVATADAGVGALVAAMRQRRPNTLVIVSADHGEEFGDHGGHYHGTTVYDEQVRVPLVMQLPGVLAPTRVATPVSLMDVLPTLLNGLRIPISPRIVGRDLAPLLTAEAASTRVAFAETDTHTLLAQDSLRLICSREVGACRLFDVASDPQQLHDVSGQHVVQRQQMQQRLAQFTASLGLYEDQGENKYPQALRRALAGERQAALEVAGLLDDADVALRRKAAEVLFELKDKRVLSHLRRALRRDEDIEVRRYAALALTRMGEGAPLVFDMLDDDDVALRRLAALALAEQGNDRGELELVLWLRAAFPAK
ncbi:MAG TPA: hypothetical protein ENK23_02815, partial [Sorangium sp.]|nr:hypothetical protein [Sorangium sp.]